MISKSTVTPEDFTNRNEIAKYAGILAEYGLAIKSNYWWGHYPEYTVAQITEMEMNTNATLIRMDDKLIWEEKIRTDYGTSLNISIETENGFPYSMPNVLLRHTHQNSVIEYQLFEDEMQLLYPCSDDPRISILKIRNIAVEIGCYFEKYISFGRQLIS